mgnify:CR=1 FL=1
MSSLLLWASEHIFDLISATGIIAGLGYTALSFREDTQSRRLTNLVRLTEQHRDIWEEAQNNPKVHRVLDAEADLYTKPVTAEEATFVMLLLFHLHCWYRAILHGEVEALEGLKKDMNTVFALPIPRQVWQERKGYFDADFRRFVDKHVQS